MEDPVILKIKSQFDKKGNPAKIPLMSGKQFFEARSETDGVYVDNLKTQPFLPWETFSEAVECIKENGGKAKKGNATNSRLGDSNLGMDTLEGHIASKVYGCKIGDTVLKRVTPIASILAWAEICENTRGQVELLLEEELQISEGRNVVSHNSSAKEKENSDMNLLYPQPESTSIELKNLEAELEKRMKEIKKLDKQAADREEEISRLRIEFETITGKVSLLEKDLSDSKETVRRLEGSLEGKKAELEESKDLLLEKDSELETLKGKLAGKSEEVESFEFRLRKSEEKIDGLAEELRERVENIRVLDEKLSSKEGEIKELEESISIKDKDLQTLAGEVISKAGEMRRTEEKLVGKEKKINTLEAMLITAEEKVKKLEKQLAGLDGEEKLAIQLREKEEFIKQLQGTLASKEEAFSKVTEENRKYRMQQKLASEGLRQIEEQKTSKKWWKRL